MSEDQEVILTSLESFRRDCRHAKLMLEHLWYHQTLTGENLEDQIGGVIDRLKVKSDAMNTIIQNLK